MIGTAGTAGTTLPSCSTGDREEWLSMSGLDPSVHDTTPKVLRHNARSHPDEVALRLKEYGIWHETTWAGYLAKVRRLALTQEDKGMLRWLSIGFMPLLVGLMGIGSQLSRRGR